MKRKIFSIFLTLVLVCSFGLVTAVPVAVSASDTTFAGSTIQVTSITPVTDLTEAAFIAEPETLELDEVVIDAQSSPVIIEGEVSDLILGDGWPNTAYVEIGLRPEDTMNERNAGVYLIAFNTPTTTQIHLQDYTGSKPDVLINLPTQNAAFSYTITLEPIVGGFGGTADLEVVAGGTVYYGESIAYGYASTWEEGVYGGLNEDFSEAYLFYSIIADRRGVAGETYSAAVGGITIDDTLYVGVGLQFTTIQAAIDAALPGHNISVAAGVYSEWQDNGYGASAGNIIDKPLHLQGSGDDCIIRGKTGTASYMPYSPILWVKADNVEIDHFKFDGATYTEEEPKGLRSYGIQSAWKVGSTDYAATNLNVHHNTFVFIGTAVTQDRSGGGDITVAYNTMVRETRSVWYDPVGAELGSYVDKTLGGGGVKFDYVVGGSVHDNTGIETPGVGIFLHGCEDLTIGPNNVVSSGTTDPSDAGIYINGGSNITVTGNTVSNFKNGEDPMYNCGKKGAGISIYSGGCDGFTIENNNLTNNSVGVYVATVESMDTPTNVEVHNNNIEGNDDYGVCNFRFPPSLKVDGVYINYWDYDKFSAANNDVDATNNWWGYASGPAPTGDGDAVSDNVGFFPWALDEGLTTFTNDATDAIVVDGALAEDSDYTQFMVDGTDYYMGVNAFATIQPAIDAVAENGTVNVEPGTYYEHILINEALTVKSTEGAEVTIIDSNGFRYIVTIQHSDVTFEGFTVTDPTYADGSDATGILIHANYDEDVSNVQILDNIITQIRSETGNPSMFGPCGINIGFAVSKGNTLSDILISGNIITDIDNPGSEGLPSSPADHTCGINVWDGAEGVVISNNTISDIKYNGIILEHASNVLIQNNPVITGCQTGIRVEPYEGVSVSGLTINSNNFADNIIQVFDGAAKVLNIQGVLDTNGFDRVVTVDHEGSMLHTIWGTIQGGIDAAVAGDTVDVIAGTYPENVVIPAGLDNLQLVGAGDVTSIAPASGRAVALSGNLGVINGFTIKGFTLVAADANYAFIAMSGTVALPSTTNLVLRDIVVNGSERGIGLNAVQGVTLIDVHISNITGIHGDGALELTGVSDLSFIDGSIEGNAIGVRLQPTGSGDIGEGYGPNGNIQIRSSNLTGNTMAIENQDDSVVIDATYNWWGHASGPSHELSNGKKWVGKGDKVSDNVDYKPWLHKSKEDLIGKEPAYAQSVDLDNTGEYGWNTFSAPIFLDEEADTWAELVDLTDLDYDPAYRFDSDNQTFVLLTTTDNYTITPGEGFFIKMGDVGSLTILYSTEVNLMPPSRPLTAGWNLIGLASLEDMLVEDAFFSLAGEGQVVSPTGNESPGAVLTGDTVYVGESYWVYMLGARTLAGFTTTPVDWEE